MEDEGYTSPLEELDGSKGLISPSPTFKLFEPDKPPYYDRVIESWEEIRSWKHSQGHCGVDSRSFLTGNTFPLSNTAVDFVDSYWRISAVESEDGSLAAIKSCLHQPVHIPMHDFISHLFHLLNGRESMSFTSSLGEVHHFKRNPFVLVKGLSPTVLDNYSKKFIEVGGRFRKLSMLASREFEHDSAEGTSSIFATFKTAVGDYLKIYQTILMLNANSISTFTKLQLFIQPYHIQFQLLEHIAEVAMNKSPISLISELNRLILVQETPCVLDLLRSFFVLIASTYMKYISDWIFRGELASPIDFHIKENSESVAKDRRFWTRQFVQFEKVPLFIRESTDLIFETGKAIHLLNLIKNIDHSPCTSHLFSYDTTEVLAPCTSFDELSILATEWETKLELFMLENQHLSQGIQESISDVLDKSFKNVELDFSLIDSIRQTHLLSRSESQAQNLLRKRSEQRKFRLSLQEQVEESALKKAFEKERELMEEKVNATYVAKKEKEYDDEKILFREKYFSEFDSSTSPVSKIVATEVKILEQTPPQSNVLPDDHVQKNSPNRHEKTSRTSLEKHFEKGAMGPKVGQNVGLDEVDSPNQASKIGNKPRRTTTRKRNFNKKVGKTIEEILAFKQEDTELGDGSVSILLEDGEEKLDPEKFILTKSQPLAEFDPRILNEIPNPIPEKDSSQTAPCCVEASSLNMLFAQSIAIPLQAQHKMVNTALLYYFIKENQLFHHLAILNEFVLLQNGVFARSLTTLLIDEMRTSPVTSLAEYAKKTGSQQSILNEALSLAYFNRELDPLIENLSFTLGHDGDPIMKEIVEIESGKSSSHVSSEFQVLNALRLSYVVDWPLNIILTEDMLHHYESLFGIFMQLSRSEHLLNQVFVQLKSKRSKSSQLLKLQLYRHKLLHFVRTLRVYMSMEVVQNGWSEFCVSLPHLHSLQHIYDHIVRFVRDISANCFLNFSSKGSGILKLIWRHLAIVESFCSQILRICEEEGFNWDEGSEVKEKAFVILRRKYAATWQFQKMILSTLYKVVGKDLYPPIELFLALNNFNTLFEQRPKERVSDHVSK